MTTGDFSDSRVDTLQGMAIATVETVNGLQERLSALRPVFVPTMGALHAGHAALIRRAREMAGPERLVVVSVFVNPAQFAPHEDFSRYPRQLERDLITCDDAGADVVFTPNVNEVYPAGQDRVTDDFVTPPLPAVATQPHLEDAFRPTHFAGVCKVVARLFDIVRPSHAFFGEKDYQQLRVITEMVRQQQSRWHDLQIVPHPTIRERDGLAMSSRNVYLTSENRHSALGIHAALFAATQERPFRTDDAEFSMRRMLEAHGLTIEYAVVRDPVTLLPMVPIDPCPTRALIAARIGSVRLIDNIAIEGAR